MEPKTGAVCANTRAYTDLAHLEPPPAASFDGMAHAKPAGVSGSMRASVSAQLSEASMCTSSPTSATMSYDALADALNEQYSTSLPASDFSDLTSSSSSSFDDIGMEWMKVRWHCPACSTREGHRCEPLVGAVPYLVDQSCSGRDACVCWVCVWQASARRCVR